MGENSSAHYSPVGGRGGPAPGKVVTAEDVRSLGFAVLGDHNVSKGVVSTTRTSARAPCAPAVSRYHG